jgi:hypothetical protein
MNKLQRIIHGYRCNRSWGDGRLEAFYWIVFRNKSFGEILDWSEFDLLSMDATKWISYTEEELMALINEKETGETK